MELDDIIYDTVHPNIMATSFTSPQTNWRMLFHHWHLLYREWISLAPSHLLLDKEDFW